MRVCMSVAVLDMEDELGWSDAQKGYVLSAFYWGKLAPHLIYLLKIICKLFFFSGYAIGQLPSGWLAQRYGAKHLLGSSVLVPSILTLFVPSVARKSYDLLLFICALRGLFASSTFPACYYFFGHWIPTKEKTAMVTTVMGGMYLVSYLNERNTLLLCSCCVCVL